MPQGFRQLCVTFRNPCAAGGKRGVGLHESNLAGKSVWGAAIICIHPGDQVVLAKRQAFVQRPAQALVLWQHQNLKPWTQLALPRCQNGGCFICDWAITHHYDLIWAQALVCPDTVQGAAQMGGRVFGVNGHQHAELGMGGHGVRLSAVFPSFNRELRPRD